MVKRQLPNPSEIFELLHFKTPELNPRRRRLDAALTTWDLRKIAKRRTPAAAFDYTDGAAEGEVSLRRARQAFRDIEFHPDILHPAVDVDTSCEILGGRSSMPFGIAPTGFTRLMQTEGEVAGAGAAGAAGIPFTLSTLGTTSIEDVKAANPHGRNWFQLYVMKDKGFVERLINRAKAAKCSALVITLDLQILGQRHKDIKNGLSSPPKPTLTNLINLATKPYWCWHMLHTKRRTFGNIVGHASGVSDTSSLSAWTSQQFDPALSWDDVAWIKDKWGGKIIIKGIMEPEDAHLAVKSGADALIVSNHGGRQLDGALPSIEALPAIVDAVGKDNIEIYLDSGVRSGQDVIRSVAMGARGVFIGRPFLYGLGAMGEAGVTKALEVIRNEADLTMAFCGLRNIKDVNKSILVPGTYPT